MQIASITPITTLDTSAAPLHMYTILLSDSKKHLLKLSDGRDFRNNMVPYLVDTKLKETILFSPKYMFIMTVPRRTSRKRRYQASRHNSLYSVSLSAVAQSTLQVLHILTVLWIMVTRAIVDFRVQDASGKGNSILSIWWLKSDWMSVTWLDVSDALQVGY